MADNEGKRSMRYRSRWAIVMAALVSCAPGTPTAVLRETGLEDPDGLVLAAVEAITNDQCQALERSIQNLRDLYDAADIDAVIDGPQYAIDKLLRGDGLFTLIADEGVVRHHYPVAPAVMNGRLDWVAESREGYPDLVTMIQITAIDDSTARISAQQVDVFDRGSSEAFFDAQFVCGAWELSPAWRCCGVVIR